MVKTAKAKVVHKQRTIEELRIALATLAQDEQDDEYVAVLQDGIDELLALRTRTEEMRMFVQEWQVKLSRRA